MQTLLRAATFFYTMTKLKELMGSMLEPTQTEFSVLLFIEEICAEDD